MRTKLLALALLAGTSLFGRRYYVPPPPPLPPAYAYAPPRPGPGFVFSDGYWFFNGRGYIWRPGYWTRAPYPGARWIGPRHHKRSYYDGYWRR